MTYRAFCQFESAIVDVRSLDRAAQRYFDSRIESIVEAPGSTAAIALRTASGVHSFTIRARLTTPADRSDALEAESRGRAGGMARLAARCPTVWEVDPVPNDDAHALFLLCAVLASVCLGPILPPDRSTLFGVRGALHRAGR